MVRGSEDAVAVCSTCRSIFAARETEDGEHYVIGIEKHCPNCDDDEFEIVTVDSVIEGEE